MTFTQKRYWFDSKVAVNIKSFTGSVTCCSD